MEQVLFNGEEFMADTSAIYRGAETDDANPASGDMLEGDVLVATAEIATGDMDSVVEIKQVVTGELALLLVSHTQLPHCAVMVWLIPLDQF